MKKEIEIKSEETVFDNYLKIDKSHIKHSKANGSVLEYSRFKLVRPDAVAALVLNVDTNNVILVKQFRYPIATREPYDIIEIVAGKIDNGETPEQSICREIMEEIGYLIDESDLELKKEIYPSPGYSTEKIYTYIVRVNNAMKTSNGGGVESEQENLEIIEMPVDEFMSLCREGKIIDAKTLLTSHTLFLQSIEILIDKNYTISKLNPQK